MDLEPILIRAEALFNRFHRLIDAIDKKGNFPTPRKRLTEHERTSSSASNPATPLSPPAASSSRTSPASAAKGKGKGSPADAAAKDQATKVITPELRKLLSREVELLPARAAAATAAKDKKKADGFPTRS